MKFLTTKQKQWFFRKTIKVNNFYMFPRYGFTIYTEPKYSGGEYFSTNPFTKSLDHESFTVKEIKNGFCRGNFYDKPLKNDWWITEEDLSRRDFIEVILLFILCFVPLVIYNWFKGGVEKIENLK
jgi:hypothetical protein